MLRNVKLGHPVHGFGLIPDPEGHVYNGFHMHVSSTLKSLPDASNMRKFIPPIWNQAQTGSCGGHGTAGGIATTFASKGHPLPCAPHPKDIYANARCIDRVPDADGTLPKLVDWGTSPNALERSTNLWGVPLSSEVNDGFPADSPYYASYLEAHVNDEPEFMSLEASTNRIIVGLNAIRTTGQQKVIEACQALADGYAIMAAVAAGNNAFQGFSGEGVLDFTGTAFDHWIYFADYRTNDKGEREFYLVNSWGVGIWTPTGTAWVTQKFFMEGTGSVLVANLGL
jgi:hypothetical protein